MDCAEAVSAAAPIVRSVNLMIVTVSVLKVVVWRICDESEIVCLE